MKRVISIAVSLVILGVIYYNIDCSEFLNLLRNCNLKWLAAGFLMFIPTVFFPSVRLRLLAPDEAGVTSWDAVKLILAAGALNVVLPSKMGDIAKGYFISERGGISLPTALSLVIYEKICDVLSLLLWCAFGLVFYVQGDGLFLPLSILIISGLGAGLMMISSKSFALFFFRSLVRISPRGIASRLEELGNSWVEMQAFLINRRGLAVKVTVLSVAVWFTHLIQIWFFIFSLGGFIALPIHLGLTPLAIFSGLIPVTFAGIGTRDAALIFFLQDYIGVTVAAALGVFCTLRYFVPAMAGLPFLSRYIELVRSGEGKPVS